MARDTHRPHTGLALYAEDTERICCDEDVGEFYRKGINGLFHSPRGKRTTEKTTQRGKRTEVPSECSSASPARSEAKCKTVIKKKNNKCISHPWLQIPRWLQSSSPGNPLQTDCGSGFSFHGKTACFLFFSTALPPSSRSIPAAGGDRMPEQMEQRVLANPPFVPNK